MGLFDKIFGKRITEMVKAYTVQETVKDDAADGQASTKTKPGSKDIIDKMVMMADMAMNDGNYERAV